jgi:uncharacterized membrane protein YcfT
LSGTEYRKDIQLLIGKHLWKDRLIEGLGMRLIKTSLMVGTNLLLYFLMRGVMHVAMGEAATLPFMDILPGIIFIVLLPVFYIIRMLKLPAKLIRGEE